MKISNGLPPSRRRGFIFLANLWLRRTGKPVLQYSLIAAVVAGCSTTQPLPPDKSEFQEVNRIATQQLPPEPVYNRLRWVYLPDVVPARDVGESSAPMLKPVFHFEVKNANLDKAAKVLASTSRYDSYCAASVADQKITLNRLGTIDELAEAIEQQAGIRVVVDHDTREVRFLAQEAENARFFEGSR